MKTVRRYPLRKNDPLQGWDSADELILQHIAQIASSDLQSKRILILNEQWGALSCSLEQGQLTTYTDSFSSAKAVDLNSEGRVQPINRLEELKGPYHLALIKIPKNLSFFEDLLCSASAHLAPGAQVICGYMVKHQTKTSFELLNRIIGKTTTSLARKKARLIFCEFENRKFKSPYPVRVDAKDLKEVFDGRLKFPLIRHSGVFSREKLDIGTRFFLEHIPEGNFKTILDLGCGDGIIGIAAKMIHPQSKIIFADDSKMALESAKANYETYFPKSSQSESQFIWDYCGETLESQSLDLVLCNPPFHQGHTVTDSIALEMFKNARKTLVLGGTLRVIGNTHLRYSQLLERIFGNSRTVARHPKFTVVECIREE